MAIEGLIGSLFNDFLIGDGNANDLAGLDGNDDIYGDGGNDILQGGNGADTLDGAAGADRYIGGAGGDVFILRAGQAAGDALIDFDGPSGDQLQLFGYGLAADGAHLTHDAGTRWTIHFADGLVHDTISVVNGASVDAFVTFAVEVSF
jgi:Ca2+-binding RTX toxin-like protein